LSSLALVLLATPAKPAEDPARKPNVIFILADDMGWTDLGCQGSKYYESPNIDRLAAQGRRFTNGYSCGPNCTPTRAALMTGQYGPRTGAYTVGSIDRFDWQSRPLRPVDNVVNLPLEKMTVAQAMKSAGYATAMFGKWHNGTQGAYHPSQRGFDEAITSQGAHFDFKTEPQVDYPKGQYLADFLTDRAVDFIKRKKDGPFFLYLPHFAVHAPHNAKPELIAKFKDKAPAGGHYDPTYAAMIYSVDESVGRILALLDELKIADNTLVIFSSDNGGVGGYKRAGVETGKEITDNAPLRGGKGMLYEGGVRVPFIFRWPGHIAAGTTSGEPICSVDLFPTLVELAAASRPTNHVLDGVSVTPVLFSRDPKASLGRDAIYWHFPGYLGAKPGNWRTTPAGAIRSGDYKLIEFFEDGRLELYDVTKDISQTNNLAAKEPAKVKELHEKLIAWRQSVGAKMPTKNTEQADDAAGGKKKQRKRNRQAAGDGGDE
jgi:arylsulfatase A-like enzyme